MLGMFKLLKHMEIENLWIRLFGAIVYTFSGFIAAHLTMGHISFHNIVYIPWLASLFVWSHKNDKFSFAIPVLLAIMVYAGQNVPSIFIILILFSFLFYTKLKRFFIYILLGILLSLPKIISSYQLLSWFPRKLEIGYVSKSWIETFKVMIKALIWPNQQWLNYKSDSVVGAWELNGYVGILVLVLAIVCIIKYKTFVKQQKYIKSMLLVILFAVLLYPGNLNPIWYILSKNIAINSLHIPTRFIGLLSLPLAVLSAIGLYYISEKIIKRNNIILPVICLFIYWDYFRVNQPYFDHVQDKCTIENKSYFDKENNFTHDVGPDWNSISSTVFETDFMSKYLQDNKGVLQYFEALLGYDSYGFLRRSLVRGGNIGLYNKNPDINIKWISPSKVKVELTKNNKENMEIPININYLPGWRIISKKEGVSLNKDWTPSRWGLLTVFLDEKFPIGEKEKIELKFSPTLIVKLGFIIAIMTLMLIFVVAHLARQCHNGGLIGIKRNAE